jgi:hypothetical protein
MQLLAVVATLQMAVALMQKNVARRLAGVALPLNIAVGEETCVQGWFLRTKATTHYALLSSVHSLVGNQLSLLFRNRCKYAIIYFPEVGKLPAVHLFLDIATILSLRSPRNPPMAGSRRFVSPFVVSGSFQTPASA